MSRNSIFISYARRHRDDVEDLIDYLEDVGLKVWYDREIRMGDFRDWIAESINNSRAVIVILTPESVGPNSSGWIEKEIDMARDSGLQNLILPCFVGDFLPPEDLAEKITFLQSVSVSEISDLRSHPEFREHVHYLRDLIAGTVSAVKPRFTSKNAVTPADWFAADPQPTSADISLALATTLLEYKPADLVVEVAREIAQSIEDRFGEKTDEERAKEPRELSMTTASDRFDRIMAERVTLADPSGAAARTVLRFKDRNWRGALLRHVWDEMDDVREVIFSWMTKRLGKWRHDEVDRAIVQTLGSLAQHDLHSLRHRLLDGWLVPSTDIRPVFVASDVIASAAENDANLPQIRDLLLPLAKPMHGNKAIRLYCKQLAVVIAMGRLALRRPDISVDVMKAVGRALFEDEDLRLAARNSLAIYGQKVGDETEALTTLTLSENADDTAQDYSLPDTTQDAPLDFAKITDEGRVAPSRAVPASIFLAEIADWADADAPNVGATIKRHTPITTLMHAFYGMPFLDEDDRTRLTLQDLTSDIASQDISILNRIVAGFVRAGMAKARLGYLPRRDMQLVFKSFARARRAALKDGTEIPSPDPYLSFAGLVYTALSAVSPDNAAYVIDGSDRWISAEDKAEIRAGGPLPDWLKRTKDEID